MARPNVVCCRMNDAEKEMLDEMRGGLDASKYLLWLVHQAHKNRSIESIYRPES